MENVYHDSINQKKSTTFILTPKYILIQKAFVEIKGNIL